MARGNNVLEIIINGTNRAGPAFKQAATQAARMGAVVSTALAAATVRAGQFEKGLAEISTLLDGDVTQSIQQIRGELLDLSTEFGQSISKMTKARYDVISAGFTDAADSAMVLRSASKLAVAGVSDVAIAADLVTSALGGLQLGADESERVINVLFQTVRKGKTTLDQLGRGLGKVFGTAKIAKVSLEELGAVMATATASGVQTAEAVTGLNALLLALSAPTEEAKQALADAGIDMRKGLLQTLIDINAAAGESPAKMRELIPSIEALRVASVVAGNLGLMTENLKSMGNAAGVVDDGVEKMAAIFDFQLRRAKRSLDALVIEVGTAFLPAATEMLENLNLLARGFREGDTDIKALAKTIGKWALGITAAGAALSVLSSIVAIIGPAIAAMGVAFATASLPAQLMLVAVVGLTAAYARFGDEIWEIIPPLNAVAKVAGFVKDRLDEMGAGLDQAVFNRRVTDKMKELMELKDTPFAGNIFQETDLARLREYAELIVRAQDASGPPERDNFVDKITDSTEEAKAKISDLISGIPGMLADASREGQAALAGLMAEISATFEQMAQAQKDAEEIKRLSRIPLGFIPHKPFEGRDGPITEESVEKTTERVSNIREQLESLAEFTAEDFIDMAFNIGSAFANVATQVASHLFGLTKGPLMLGRAFKQMAVSILSDLAQIIARMLVARALLSLFSFGSGSVVGAALSQAAGYNTGGVVPTAATGYSVPGGAGDFFPPIILPGSSGLDRRPILAAGGEAVISKQHVNAMQAAIKQPQTSPRRDTGGRGRGTKVQIDLQANRPFRRSEQVELTDSVTEGIERSARYGS